jgi:uncharacterized protein (TIGR02284 family)
MKGNSMIRPHSLDAKTIEQLRRIVAQTYAGRDDLYAAADSLNDEDLVTVCRKLADELAANSETLQQIILMQGAEAVAPETITSLLTKELASYLRENAPKKLILAGAKDSQSKLRGEYDAAIEATEDSEAEALLRRQREDVDFGERVLRRLSEGEDGS